MACAAARTARDGEGTNGDEGPSRGKTTALTLGPSRERLHIRRTSRRGDAVAALRRAQPAVHQAFHDGSRAGPTVRGMFAGGRPPSRNSRAPRTPRPVLRGGGPRADPGNRAIEKTDGLGLHVGVVLP